MANSNCLHPLPPRYFPLHLSSSTGFFLDDDNSLHLLVSLKVAVRLFFGRTTTTSLLAAATPQMITNCEHAGHLFHELETLKGEKHLRNNLFFFCHNKNPKAGFPSFPN
jgi:hypothetical protein